MLKIINQFRDDTEDYLQFLKETGLFKNMINCIHLSITCKLNKNHTVLYFNLILV